MITLLRKIIPSPFVSKALNDLINFSENRCVSRDPKSGYILKNCFNSDMTPGDGWVWWNEMLQIPILHFWRFAFHQFQNCSTVYEKINKQISSNLKLNLIFKLELFSLIPSSKNSFLGCFSTPDGRGFHSEFIKDS